VLIHGAHGSVFVFMLLLLLLLLLLLVVCGGAVAFV
jgi:hypothetical protein